MITSNNILEIINVAQKEIKNYDEIVEQLCRYTPFPLSDLNASNLRRTFSEIIMPYNRHISLAIIDEETQLLIQILTNSTGTFTCLEDRDSAWKSELLASKIYVYILDYCLRITNSNITINKDYSWYTGNFRNLSCRSRIVVHTEDQYIAILSRSLDAIGTFQIPTEVTVKHLPISGCIYICEDCQTGRDVYASGTVITMMPGSKYNYQINTTALGYQPYIAIEIGSGIINNTVKTQIGFKPTSFTNKIIAFIKKHRIRVHPVNVNTRAPRTCSF